MQKDERSNKNPYSSLNNKTAFTSRAVKYDKKLTDARSVGTIQTVIHHHMKNIETKLSHDKEPLLSDSQSSHSLKLHNRVSILVDVLFILVAGVSAFGKLWGADLIFIGKSSFGYLTGWSVSSLRS